MKVMFLLEVIEGTSEAEKVLILLMWLIKAHFRN